MYTFFSIFELFFLSFELVFSHVDIQSSTILAPKDIITFVFENVFILVLFGWSLLDVTGLGMQSQTGMFFLLTVSPRPPQPVMYSPLPPLHWLFIMESFISPGSCCSAELGMKPRSSPPSLPLFFFLLLVLGLETRALHMTGKCAPQIGIPSLFGVSLNTGWEMAKAKQSSQISSVVSIEEQKPLGTIHSTFWTMIS